MIKRRKHKAYAVLVQTLLRDLRRRGHIDAEGSQDVRAATATAGRPIAMLRHRQARTGDHERRSGRNVESLGAARSGSRGVDETGVIGIDPNRSLPHALS